MSVSQTRLPMLIGAITASALVVTAVLAFDIPVTARVDTQVANSFWLLQRPGLSGAEHTLVNAMDIKPCLLLSAGLVLFAALRRRPILVGVSVLILLGSNLSTEILKSLMPAHTAVLPGSPVVTAGAFPSGHATACMSLVLCATAIAPVKLRPAVAAIGLIYALIVGTALIVLGVHYASDVIGGFLMALLWALLGVTILRGVRVRKADLPAREESAHLWGVATAVAWVLALGICAGALAIILAPPEIATVALGAAVCVIGFVAAIAIALIAHLSPTSPSRWPSMRMATQPVPD